MPASSHRDARGALLLSGLALALALAPAAGCWKQPHRNRPIAARVGSHAISLEAVDRRIRRELFEEQLGRGRTARLHERRRQTLDAMIDDYLLEREASRAGVEPKQWLEDAIRELAPVSEAEVEAFFEAHREEIGEGIALDELAPRIRAHIARERQEEIFERLRTAADVTIALERPRLAVGVEGPSRGPEDAPITLVEWSDFQCPYCARAEPIIEELLERHPDAIRLVYRHLPLSFHEHARLAAQAAVCAEAQQRFWDYHRLLFANQRALARADLLGYAKHLQLDIDTFSGCLDDELTVERVDRDIASARELGATATPSFYLNGIPIRGAQPIDVFEKIIADELARPR